MFDYESMTWTKLPNMPTPLYRGAIVGIIGKEYPASSLNLLSTGSSGEQKGATDRDLIFVFGGATELITSAPVPMSTIDMYDSQLRTWQHLTIKLPCARHSALAINVPGWNGYNGIVLLGGITSSSSSGIGTSRPTDVHGDEYIRYVEYYCPIANRFTRLDWILPDVCVAPQCVALIDHDTGSIWLVATPLGSWLPSTLWTMQPHWLTHHDITIAGCNNGIDLVEQYGHGRSGECNKVG
jgi:hypothetical protein